MSRLYLSERGRVIRSIGEELTTFRRARKILTLPQTASPAALYFLVRAYTENAFPLHIAVNGIRLNPVFANNDGAYRWHEVTIDSSNLKEGENKFDFWTDATAMNAWSLALEPGQRDPKSQVSDDSGESWRNHEMSYLNAVSGEFIVRIRLAEGKDPSPPAMAWEDPDHPRCASLRKGIPEHIIKETDPSRIVRELSAWISSSWEHTGSSKPIQYSPWDAETILSWAKNRVGHGGHPPVAYCVHFAVTFVTCCQALEIPARCAIICGTPNGHDGHFVGEVWLDRWKKWVMMDPNLDATYWNDEEPLSITEIQGLGDDLEKYLRFGKGNEFQGSFPHIQRFTKNLMNTGLCFRYRSIWPRVDFLSRPDKTPPGHGMTPYSESEMVWDRNVLKSGFGMYPYFADPVYFEKPPEGH